MKTCIFCHHISEQALSLSNRAFQAGLYINPIQTGHLLLISKDHYTSISQLPLPILHELVETQAHLVGLLEECLPIDGVTIASNDKDLMDDGTHFHIHLIPRLKGDAFWIKSTSRSFPTHRRFSKRTKKDEPSGPSFMLLWRLPCRLYRLS